MKRIFFLFFILGIVSPILSQNPCPGTATVTYAGKTYNTVQIGSQCWLKENLDVGTMIQGSANQTNNGTIEKYCYKNDANNCATYGGLYQWAEVVQYNNGASNESSPDPAFSGNVQGICPNGWHIPSYAEFVTLKTTVASSRDALLAVGQMGSGKNTSGFSALFASSRNLNGSFSDNSNYIWFWSSTESYGTYAYFFELESLYPDVYIEGYYKSLGLSVRCVKDSPTSVEENKEEINNQFSLSQNYPNPFNPETTIKYSVPKNEFVIVKVFDILGRELNTLVNKQKFPGNYEIKFNATNLSSGIYFYKIQAGDFTQTKKMILIK